MINIGQRHLHYLLLFTAPPLTPFSFFRMAPCKLSIAPLYSHIPCKYTPPSNGVCTPRISTPSALSQDIQFPTYMLVRNMPQIQASHGDIYPLRISGSSGPSHDLLCSFRMESYG